MAGPSAATPQRRFDRCGRHRQPNRISPFAGRQMGHRLPLRPDFRGRKWKPIAARYGQRLPMALECLLASRSPSRRLISRMPRHFSVARRSGRTGLARQADDFGRPPRLASPNHGSRAPRSEISNTIRPTMSNSVSRGWTRRQALEALGIAGAASVVPKSLRADEPTFPKGAIIRCVLKDYAPEELAGGATLFHEHMQLAADFNAKFTAATAAARAANGLPALPARGGRPPPRAPTSCTTPNSWPKKSRRPRRPGWAALSTRAIPTWAATLTSSAKSP